MTFQSFSIRYGRNPHYAKGYRHGVKEYKYGSNELLNSAEEEQEGSVVASFPPTKITYYAPVPSVPLVKYHG